MKKTILLAALALAACSGEPTHFSGPLVAIDGDTIRSGGERLRLAGIDAPEMPGHCRPGRHCVRGDPYRSRQALQSLLDQRWSWCAGEDRDAYGRVLVTCYVDEGRTNRNINLWMVEHGYAQPYEYRRPQ